MQNENNKTNDNEVKVKNRQRLINFNKPASIANMLIVVISFSLCVYNLAVDYRVNAEFNTKLRHWALLVVSISVYLFQIVTRIRFSTLFQIIVNLHIFFAGTIGSGFGLYSSTKHYDDAMHALFGFVVSIVGLYVICRLANIYEERPLVVAIFIFGFCAIFGVLWEFWEYSVDLLFNIGAQGGRVPGYNAPLVTDTMHDLMFNTSGSLVFLLLYLLHVKTSKNFLIKSFKKDFSN